MRSSLPFWLAVLAGLVTCLQGSVWLRHRALSRAREARLRAIEGKYPPRAFDSSAIAPQITRVRQDYAALARRRWRPDFHRAGLVAAAQRIIAHFAYFRRAGGEQELHRHQV